ncbi:Signal transduction histidine kinase CheA [hydrothermal vent metagenome]|uniref:histidine kinase n=1 Tax=hydrothermal vent metagenome TaxID=652676 RepID=A0A3B1B822_9ZZZZ
MKDAQDFSTLPWIKDELDELMRQAGSALEEYIEGSGDKELIQTCIERLHQIYGTLRMVQMFGASMLAEEMELAASALKSGKVAHRSEAAEILMQALIQLPDYLDKMQSGYRDIPLLVLPLMNDLRAARDADLLSEVALFAPALEQRLMVGPESGEANAELPKLARRLRHCYHKGLLLWYRGEKRNNGLSVLADVMHRLEQEAGTEYVRQLFRIARAAVAALQDEAIEPGIAIKLLHGRLDRQIKLLIDEGEAALVNAPATELQKNLLYYIALADSDNELIQAIKQTFELGMILPTAEEIEAGRKELSGPNRELLEALRDAIKNDLVQVQDRLDLFIRSAPRDTDDLLNLERPLRKIADTLGMVGQGELRERMKGRANQIRDVNAGGMIPDDAALMDMAGDILFVETSLNSWVPSQVFPAVVEQARQVGITPEKEGEFGELVQAVFSEAGVDMAHIKEAIVAYIDSPADKSLLADVPKRFFDVSGALKMLGLSGVSVLLDFIAQYINSQFLADDLILDTEQVNTLADAITSIEYHMEAVIEGRSGQGEILDVARNALVQLGWNQDGAVVPIEAAKPDLEIEPALEPEILPSADPPAMDDLDSEIIEIFVEEAREELAVVQEYLPKWRHNHEELDVLTTLRRSFHTLKGSGRMVGAKSIGELAWSIENLLNRIIDRTVPVSSRVFTLLDDVIEALPGLIDQQAAGEMPDIADIQPLMDRVIELTDSELGAGNASGKQEAEEPDTQSQLSMETELLGIFTNESKGHIAVIMDFIEMCGMGGSRHPTEKISRAFHTLHGSAHMAGVDPMAEIGGALEALVNGLIAAEKPAEDAEQELIVRGLKDIETVLASINVAAAELPDWRSFVAEVEQLIPELDEAVLPDEIDLLQEEIIVDIAQMDEDEQWLLEDEDDLLLDGASLLLEDLDSEVLLEAEETEEKAEAELLDDDCADPLPVGDNLLLEEPDSEIALTDIEIVEVDELFQELTVEVEPVADEDEDEATELLAIFLEEAHELIEIIEPALEEWSSNTENPSALGALLRALHTLKGGSHLAGIMPVGDLTHSFESLLEGVSSGQVLVSDELVDLAHSVTDRLVEELEWVANGSSARSMDALIADVEACLPSKGEESHITDQLDGAPYVVSATAAEIIPSVAEPQQEEIEVPKQAPVEQISAQRSSEPESKESQVIRVRSEQLDRLVNYAGEVSIFRARLEQQNTDMSFNLSELDQTVVRLHNQLRNLEIETEAQILFRYEREQEADEEVVDEHDFDPLEFDRFSNMQQLSRALIETVNDLVSIKEQMNELTRENDTLLLQQFRVSNDLQDGLLRTRMVPFSQVLPRLRRLLRQTCAQLRKNATLEVHGAEGEMDRGILDRIAAPLEHILRNAVSHGIESPSKRVASGKSKTGTITLTLSRDGTDVLVAVADDGGGLKLENIRRRAVEKGLLAEDAVIADRNLMQLIMEPGFSTSDEITQISGRGVGMDVVISEVKQLGGSFEIDSQPGQGTTFTIRLPLTLAISDALLVQIGEDIYAIPHASVEGVVRLAVDDLQAYYAGIKEYFSYAGRDYQVRYLGDMLGTSAPRLAEAKKKWLPLLLVRAGDNRVALQVDGLLGNRQIVVKSVGPQLSAVRWITGGTILGDGNVALILDVNALMRTVTVQAAGQVVELPPEVPAPVIQTVMVVDDSITVRKVTTRLLERNDLRVITAKDGLDALEKLQEQTPDIMLLDIEMPRMDGFEVARHMHNSPHLSHIPIIMITSRSGDKHRNLALELGVKGYLGKPYQEADLLISINELLPEMAQ